ncbi:MAG: peptide chain release factor N(5)-glutamine methyltransferase [Pseudomonas sp.]
MSQSIADSLSRARLSGSDTPRLDAELLLAHVLGKPRSYLLTWPERELSVEQLDRFDALLARRRQGEPVAYLLGEQGFWSLALQVSPDTLIPRPDTERLVEVALELGPSGPARVLDMGTGTGAIALALAAERSQWQLIGVDRMPGAVALAESNRVQLGLHNAKFLISDWFSAVNEHFFDLIVSNPPYIAEDDPHLQQGDVRFEPASALVSGVDGLDDIRHIIEAAPDHLTNNGWLLLEHGWQQAHAVCRLLERRGFIDVQAWRDLGGQQRVSGGRWHA